MLIESHVPWYLCYSYPSSTAAWVQHTESRLLLFTSPGGSIYSKDHMAENGNNANRYAWRRFSAINCDAQVRLPGWKFKPACKTQSKQNGSNDCAPLRSGRLRWARFSGSSSLRNQCLDQFLWRRSLPSPKKVFHCISYDVFKFSINRLHNVETATKCPKTFNCRIQLKFPFFVSTQRHCMHETKHIPQNIIHISQVDKKLSILSDDASMQWLWHRCRRFSTLSLSHAPMHRFNGWISKHALSIYCSTHCQSTMSLYGCARADQLKLLPFNENLMPQNAQSRICVCLCDCCHQIGTLLSAIIVHNLSVFKEERWLFWLKFCLYCGPSDPWPFTQRWHEIVFSKCP